MVFDPATLAISAFGVAGALAVRLGILIAELQNAGEEFTDILSAFRQSQDTVSKISTIIHEPQLPAALLSEYARELLQRQNDLEEIGVLLREITHTLAHKSLFSRLRQKNLLAHGELRKLTNKLVFFNQRLMGMLAIHQSRILGVLHRDLREVRGTMGGAGAYGAQARTEAGAEWGAGAGIHNEMAAAQAVGGWEAPPPSYGASSQVSMGTWSGSGVGGHIRRSGKSRTLAVHYAQQLKHQKSDEW